MAESEQEQPSKLPTSVQALVHRLYGDPRYRLVGKVERFGRERISFIEACTILTATGEVAGHALLSREFERQGRPDGERPYGEESVLDFHLHRGGEQLSLSEEELALLRDESWQYYVRRNFDFQLGDYLQAREDAEHNLGIWSLIDRSDAASDHKWSFLKWWPWIERDRAIAQALWDIEQGAVEGAATELYRAQRSIEQFGAQHAAQYAEEEGDNRELCSHMRQHVTTLVELLRRDAGLPISLEEQLDHAAERGDQAEMERLRAEMIRRAMDEGE